MSGRKTDATRSAAERLRALLVELMLIPGLSGYEGRVRRYLAAALADLGLETRTDRLGNLIATLDGEAGAPIGHAVHPYGPARLCGAQDRGQTA